MTQPNEEGDNSMQPFSNSLPISPVFLLMLRAGTGGKANRFNVLKGHTLDHSHHFHRGQSSKGIRTLCVTVMLRKNRWRSVWMESNHLFMFLVS